MMPQPSTPPASPASPQATAASSPPAPSVAFQGEAGAFSEEALKAHFGEGVVPFPCRDFQDLVSAVEDGDTHFGMIPVENSLAGTVAPAYDALLGGRVEVQAERTLRIRHHLMASASARVSTIRKVISHPVALAQCTRFLRGHPQIQAMAVHDTAGAAREVAEAADDSLAAIAPAGAAHRYGLTILQSDLQDREDNQTRFYLIRRLGDQTPPPPLNGVRRWKTALIIELPDEPGSLLGALAPFQEEGLSLAKLESRPGPVPWSYRFIVEVHGSTGEPAMDRALRSLEGQVELCRVLGSFPVVPG